MQSKVLVGLTLLPAEQIESIVRNTVERCMKKCDTQGGCQPGFSKGSSALKIRKQTGILRKRKHHMSNGYVWILENLKF